METDARVIEIVARARASYNDTRWPVRACDRCEKDYQGPAVYCSLDCALADAG